jgi:diguanylate cyclase (GGDEF)-like protein/PAS domain S-box-containing protein
MPSILGCLTRDLDIRLVALAAGICGLGCFTAVTLMSRSWQAERVRAAVWLCAAAIVCGSSIWSLHFVAMIAYMPGMPIGYDLATTAASIIIATAGTLFSLSCWRLLPYGRVRILIGGISMGLSVCAMHYTGVASMRMAGHLFFDRNLVVLSIVVSIVFAMVGFARAKPSATIWRRVDVSFWFAMSILGAHFVGMAALRIDPDVLTPTGETVLGSGSLAVAVASVSLALLIVSLAAALMEQHLARRSVQELARMRLLSEFAQEGLIIHYEGQILEVNVAGGRLMGMAPESMIGQALPSLFADNGAPVLLQRMQDPPGERWVEETDLLTTSGTRLMVELSCQPIDFRGRPATALALRDLTDRKRNEAKIRHLAHHDSLTDLPNRFLLQDRLTRALDDAARTNTCVALLYLDLDRFKPVNDVLGHAGGDALLIEVSARLMGEIRTSDTLARVGGDEFVIVQVDAKSAEKVLGLAERLIQQVTLPFEIEGRQVEIGVSIGVAMYPSDGLTPDTLLRAADTAMYRAKQDKRGTARFFEASMDAQLHDRRLLEQDLRHATDRGEMTLFYQPLVSCKTGDVEGFEALLRWHHPQRGLLSPGAFIPLAEEIGLIAQLGQWALDTACATAIGWAKPWRVAVNVSPTQFRQSDIPSIVDAALARTGLDPARLEIEITEGVFIEDADRAVSVLSKLRSQGVRLCLDDFGTGYSSLSYLRLFRFDNIKVDQSFVRDLEKSAETATIVTAIVNLGHNLGLTVTVEGVETWQQVGFLLAQGADQLQGYLLGRPMVAPVTSELDRARIKSLSASARSAYVG